MTDPHCLRPEDIEKTSFAIIEDLLAGRELVPDTAGIVKRCIHASADFDYAETLYFSPGAVGSIKEALRNGGTIVTDTAMALAGINKRLTSSFGIETLCFIADDDVAREAKAREGTRAAVAVEKAMRLKKPPIFAVGNAPTALLRLHQAIRDEGYTPPGVIAVPVGFVNVVESKELIRQTNVPCIVARGRKGGSTIAAAICNALLLDLEKERRQV